MVLTHNARYTIRIYNKLETSILFLRIMYKIIKNSYHSFPKKDLSQSNYNNINLFISFSVLFFSFHVYVYTSSLQVASTSVFVGCGVLYLVLGVFGKLSAVFISIPNPVLGGSLITMMGMFIGVTLSNLRPVSLTSTRNLAIIGTSIMIGLIIPEYIKKFGSDIDTGMVQICPLLITLV